MRLFALRYSRKGSLVRNQLGDVTYFSNKMQAKLVRDRMGGRTVVTFGPDHKLYEGE